jgi:hypothetical protein
MEKRYLSAIVLLVLVALPALALANARLISVVPVGSGCVSGPNGPSVQSWDVEPGQAYTVTITDVTECANGGTDPTLNIRINGTYTGNFELIATNVGPGTYEFEVTLPEDAICTYPIFYCTTPGVNNSGYLVIRNDGGGFQSHLRASSFGPGCTNPVELGGELCDGQVSVDESTWGSVKVLFR